MLKKLSILVLPLVLALSAMVMFGNVNMHAVAQQNQTSSQGQGNQTSSQGQGNQTSSQGQQIPQSMDQKLLNYTNDAIKAQKDKNSKKLTSSLKLLQSALINATGKQAVFLPDSTTSGSSSGSGSSGSSSGSGSSGSSSGSGSSGSSSDKSSK
jgi:hypothetical protein